MQQQQQQQQQQQVIVATSSRQFRMEHERNSTRTKTTVLNEELIN